MNTFSYCRLAEAVEHLISHYFRSGSEQDKLVEIGTFFSEFTGKKKDAKPVKPVKPPTIVEAIWIFELDLKEIRGLIDMGVEKQQQTLGTFHNL